MAFLTDKGILIKTGCFTGSLEKFQAQVAKIHGDNVHGAEYLIAIEMIKKHVELWTPAVEGKTEVAVNE
jgi:hypothetical protein